ncbi:MAG: M1 family metallopeptidase [Gemmatimonadaceae bacterium]|nr:M1 family metallopeptidase [Gemmatimonadaceae bacterium]
MRIFALAALTAIATAHAAPLLAQARSLTGARRPGIDVLQYAFDVDLPSGPMPDTVRFVATTIARRAGGTASLALDLVSTMHVGQVEVNGRAAAFTRPGDQVVVALPPESGDSIRVSVRYRGIPADGLIIRSDSAGGWTAFGDNFPDRARQWLAVVDHPSDKALVEWTVHHPGRYRVIANGELLEETPSPGATDRIVTRWKSTRPLYTSVMVIGVARFGVFELGDTACSLAERPGCVPQSVWITPDVRDYMPGPFAKAGQIVALYSRLVGPFPYEKLAHVQSTTRYGGMENASAIFYADAIYRQRNMSEGLIAHEAAHQWFGDAVTEREWPHVWLSEGFATYFAALWTEHSQGDSAFLAEMRRMRETVLTARITNEKPIVDEGLDNLGRVLNSNVYQKAGFVLHMLRREVGDSAFYRGVRSYYAKYRHANAMTDDFMREVEAASGTKLDWFFAQWMRRSGVAAPTISWLWDPRQRSVILTLTQEVGEPYRLDLSADVTDAKGVVHRVRVNVPAGRVSTMHLPVKLDGAPTRIVFDPDASLLGKLTVK